MFVKLSLNNSTRKIKLADSSSFADLWKEVVKLAGDKADRVQISYSDMDGETIAVNCEEDWSICVEEAKIKAEGKPVITVSLKLTEVEEFARVEETNSDITQDLREVSFKEAPADDKLIEEVTQPEVTTTETEMEETKEEVKEEPKVVHEENPQDFDIETKVEIPIPKGTTPEELEEIMNAYQQDYMNQLGFPVEIVEAYVDQKTDAPEEEMEQESHVQSSLNSSTLTVDQKTEIEELIEEKFNKMFDMKKAKKDQKKAEKKAHKQKSTTTAQEDFVHYNIICDGCKKGIKNMARFKSLVIHDYDLCAECEKTGIHPGPMVRYSKPSTYAPFQLNQIYRKFINDFTPETNTTTQSAPAEHQRCPFRTHQHQGSFPRRPLCHIRPSTARDGVRHQNPVAGLLENIFNPADGILKNLLGQVLNPPRASAPAQPQTPATNFEAVATEIVTEQPAFAESKNLVKTFLETSNTTTKDKFKSLVELSGMNEAEFTTTFLKMDPNELKSFIQDGGLSIESIIMMTATN